MFRFYIASLLLVATVIMGCDRASPKIDIEIFFQTGSKRMGSYTQA